MQDSVDPADAERNELIEGSELADDCPSLKVRLGGGVSEGGSAARRVISQVPKGL